MLPLLNHTLAMVITLALLVLALCAPFLVLWICLSIRRDLRRIADSQEHVARYARSILADEELRERIADRQSQGRIANSAFGR